MWREEESGMRNCIDTLLFVRCVRVCVCTREVSFLCLCICILQAFIRKVSSRLFLCRICVTFSCACVRVYTTERKCVCVLNFKFFLAHLWEDILKSKFPNLTHPSTPLVFVLVTNRNRNSVSLILRKTFSWRAPGTTLPAYGYQFLPEHTLSLPN
jgi:hypothetical protein